MTYIKLCDSCGTIEEKKDKFHSLILNLDGSACRLDLCKNCKNRIMNKIKNELSQKSAKRIKEVMK